MGDCCDKGLFDFGGWEWIVIIVLLVIIFCPGIFGTKGAYGNNKCCN